jgi:beta-galactosidase
LGTSVPNALLCSPARQSRLARPPGTIFFQLTPSRPSSTPVTLSVLVHNREGAGGIDKPVTLMTYGAETPVTGCRMRGGPGALDVSTHWQPIGSSGAFNGPQYFRTTFTAQPYVPVGSHPIWRVTVPHLGHGSVWVNGHNLGRYPEKSRSTDCISPNAG